MGLKGIDSGSDTLGESADILALDPRINIGLFGGFSSEVMEPRKGVKGEIKEVMEDDEKNRLERAEHLKEQAKQCISRGEIKNAMKYFDRWIEIDSVEGRIHKGVILATFYPAKFMDGICEIAQATKMSFNNANLVVLFSILDHGRSNLLFKVPKIKMNNVSEEQLKNEIEFLLGSRNNKSIQKPIVGRLFLMVCKYLGNLENVRGR